MHIFSGSRKILANLLLALVGIAIGLIFAELFARRYFMVAGQFHTYNPTTGYMHLPNHSIEVISPDFTVRYTTNNLSLRGPDIDLDQLGDCVILGLGDSFTFGVGVKYEDTYLEVMHDEITSSRQLDFQVINSGHGGWGTAQQLAFLEEHLMLFHPNLVIVGVYENDVEDNLSPRIYTINNNGGLERLGPVPKSKTDEIRELASSIPLYGWLAENSALMATVRIAVWNIVKNSGSSVTESDTDDIVEINRMQRQESLLLENLLLKRIQAVAEESGASVVFLFIPNRKIEMDDDVRDMCDSEMRCVDVIDELQSSGYILDELYFPNDGHWTEKSHLIAGRTLAQYIIGNNLLGCGNQQR